MQRIFYFLLVGILCLTGLVQAEARNLVLEWNASASSGTAGYNVYYGTNSGSYTCKLDVGNATSATVSNLLPGVTYYFAATAYDAVGNESAYSTEISFLPHGVIALAHSEDPAHRATLSFPVEPGHWYEIQATTDLTNWQSIWQSGVALANVWEQFTDPDAAEFASRFYRLVMH